MHENTILTHAVNIHNKLDLRPESLGIRHILKSSYGKSSRVFTIHHLPHSPYFSFFHVFDFLPSTEQASVEEGEFKKINKMDFGC